MNGINIVSIGGNLGRDPELRKTSTGKVVAELSIACNRGPKRADGTEEQTDWIRATLWEKQAELAGRYLHKGDPVLVEGSLRVDSWTDKEENRRYKTYVAARRVHFLPRGQRPDSARPYSSDGAGESERQDIPF